VCSDQCEGTVVWHGRGRAVLVEASRSARSPSAVGWSLHVFRASLVRIFVSTFLPAGYPSSVAPEYASFQVRLACLSVFVGGCGGAP
jgi:hypothetical protein